jgi:UDP-N-acetylmuramoyl-tripeptide--D-alanyl-D-alanine ligase
LGVLAAVSLAGGDLALAALALNNLQPVTGRGERTMLELPGGSALLIDESYNANPASMAAAIALLGQSPIKLSGRRIAVLGDMLELGDQSQRLHRGLNEAIAAARIDLVYCSGPMMRFLWEALPLSQQGGYAETASALEPLVLESVRAGDAIMVKGSLGSKMGPIVKQLKHQFSRYDRLEAAAVKV